MTRNLGVSVLSAGLVVCMAGMAAQPPSDAKKPAAQPGQAEMEAWAKAAAPGPNHELIAEFEGTWKGALSMWMDPAAPPEKSEGTMVNTMVLGGRYLRQEWTGEMMGGPFEGIGYWGYDNTRKEFVSTWMDSMSTGLMISKGQYDSGKKTFTLTSEMLDPMTGQECTVREVIVVVSADEHRMEMYAPDPQGKEFKTMEIVYTRLNAAPTKVGQ